MIIEQCERVIPKVKSYFKNRTERNLVINVNAVYQYGLGFEPAENRNRRSRAVLRRGNGIPVLQYVEVSFQQIGNKEKVDELLELRDLFNSVV